jgi:multiple antibiotic resistance protein
MHIYITSFLLFFTSFFTLINPVGAMPVFMTMTNLLSDSQKRRTALRACLTAFLTLLIFAFGGQLLFRIFGISVNGFRVVGGIIFFQMGYDMLNAKLSRIKIEKSQVREYVDDISITPLGIPIIAGPGSITNSIVLMEDAQSVMMKVVLIASIAATLILTYIAMVGSGKFVKIIGETGNKIMMKLMGLIVMVIAVEFMVSGLTPIIRGILKIN